jgi:capsular exopolysaccharide synthesis family protein
VIADMELRDVLRALRASWWMPVLGLLLVGGVALGGSLLMTPAYTAHTQLFVSTSGTTSTSDVLTGSQFSQQRVTSYARLLTGEELAGRVIRRLGLDSTPADLTDRISATAVQDTVLIDVTVTDPSPRLARQIALTVGSEFRSMVRDLETPPGATTTPVTVTVSDRPELPQRPSEPQTIRNVGIGLLAGLLLGGAGAVARARLDRSVKRLEEIGELTGAAVVGTIVRDDALAKTHVADRAGGGRVVEDFRQLRTNLQFLNVDRPPTVVMVSSPLPAEGKTTVVVNLALALADAGRRVVVVEADLRRPKVTKYLGLVGGVGLTNVLAGTAELGEVMQSYSSGRLSVLAAGPTPPNPGELLASSHMGDLLEKLRSEYDYVLVDAPPLLPVADASGLAARTDGVLLALRYGSTTRDQLRQTATTLDRVGATCLGVVVTVVPPKADIVAGHGYGYDYEYDYAPAAGRHVAR